ncbi:MAG TPA: DNA-processing protein DprA [Desulfobacteria bacterium]|nr:DNA-processing protein DprA [Desulfobacteria bacterium]
MGFRILTTKDKHFPKRLMAKLGSAFPQFTAFGNLDILIDAETAIAGLFCSRSCPGSLVLPALDHVRILRDTGRTVIGGFHSHMEQECLNLLLRGTQPIVICPARSIGNIRMPDAWKKPLVENRLLVVSPFAKSHKRVTAKLANQRNDFVAALSDEIFIIHAGTGTGTFDHAVKAIKAGKKTYTIDITENRELIRMGAVPARYTTPERKDSQTV